MRNRARKVARIIFRSIASVISCIIDGMGTAIDQSFEARARAAGVVLPGRGR